MNRFRERVREFFLREEAATTVEYATMLALIVIVSWAAMSGMGQSVEKSFATVEKGIRPGGGG